LLERLGHRHEVNAKAKLGGARPVRSFVVKGEADVRSSRIPELLGVAGIEIVGRLRRP